MLEYQNKALATLNKQHTLKIADLERELDDAHKLVQSTNLSLNTLADVFSKVSDANSLIHVFPDEAKSLHSLQRQFPHAAAPIRTSPRGGLSPKTFHRKAPPSF